MNIKLDINDRAFFAIKNLEKKVELRVNTGKRDYSLIQIGDIIEFENSTKDNIKCLVKKNIWYKTAEELLVMEGTKYTLSSTNDVALGVKSINSYKGYKNGIEENGIYAIHLEYIEKEHSMKLEKEYFEYIKYGTKRIEIRLNDEKRRNISIGDTIKFTNISTPNEKINTEVSGLLQYDTFENLIDDIDIKLLCDEKISKKQLLNILRKFYNEDQEKRYGVLGIKINILNNEIK